MATIYYDKDADLEQVLADPKGGIKKTSDRKSIYYRRTHMSDALGYWIFYEQPVQAAQVMKFSGGVPIKQPGYGFVGG